MNERQKILHDALAEMLNKIDNVLQSYGYKGEPVKMVLAGGMAVSFYCGTRYTEDVDATFSRKILLPYEDLVVHYTKEDGSPGYIYFDTNYSPALALMHENYEEDIVSYSSINHEGRAIELFVLSPIDLAISKISRFSDQDVEDILVLAEQGYFNVEDLRSRATEALSYYIGNTKSVENSIELICRKISDRVSMAPHY